MAASAQYKGQTPASYQACLEAAQLILASGKTLNPSALATATGRTYQSCAKLLHHGWKGRDGEQLPFAPPLLEQLEVTHPDPGKTVLAPPGSNAAAAENPALDVAKAHVANTAATTTPAAIAQLEHLTPLDLAREVGRANLVLSLKVGRLAVTLADALENAIARQLVLGEVDAIAAFKMLRAASEVLRNSSAAASAAIESELALVNQPGNAAEAHPMTPEEAKAVVARAALIHARAEARARLAEIPGMDTSLPGDDVGATVEESGAMEQA